MSPIFLFLLGNRDLQIEAAHPLAQSKLVKKYFVPHNDDIDRLIIRKEVDAWFTFEEASREVLAQYEQIKDAVVFPMISQSLAWWKDRPRPRLVFCTTRQEPIHWQDCHALAQFAERYFAEQGYETETRFFPHNPNHFDALAAFFNDLFGELGRATEQLIISNSGGTPTMRSASHFSGIFRGFTYLQIETGGKVNLTTFNEQERVILREIVEKQLAMFDYQGIQLLPGIPEAVQEACAEAQNLYNLKDSRINPDLPYDEQAVQAIKLIYSNLRVCFHRGGYADAIGRIFRLEEALGQLLLYRELKANGYLNAEGHVMSPTLQESLPYEHWLSNKTDKLKFIKRHYATILEPHPDPEKRGLVFKGTRAPLGPISGGKNFFYFFFQTQEKHPDLYGLLAEINQQYFHDPDPYSLPPTLAKLRNFSILGHGYRGISQADLESVLGDFGSFPAFYQALETVVEAAVGIQLANQFEAENEKIRQLLP